MSRTVNFIEEVPKETICPYCGIKFNYITKCMMHVFKEHPEKYPEWMNNRSEEIRKNGGQEDG